MPPPSPQLPRRQLLQALALAPMAAAFPNITQAADAGLITGNVCLLAPELTEGPFYLDPKLLRSEIAEGSKGTPLQLRLQVVRADCTPIAGARVDVWHCDAQGVYSGVEGAVGQTFLRGTQISDTQGVVAFRTIYPGWYPGRAIHIHYKVILNDRDMVTSQVFFDEAITAQVLAGDPSYAPRGGPDVPLDADRIARRAGEGAVSATERRDGVWTSSLVVGVADGGSAGSLSSRMFG